MSETMGSGDSSSTQGFVPLEEMQGHAAKIRPAYTRFTELINARLAAQNGRVDQTEINAAVYQAIQDVQAADSDRRIINAFFDTYVGAWCMHGRDMANYFAQQILDEEGRN